MSEKKLIEIDLDLNDVIFTITDRQGRKHKFKLRIMKHIFWRKRRRDKKRYFALILEEVD
ncbi:MAG: hypothetical protein DRG33_00910 [Deltaproteobacteria bacterium]|nr:MAG: hypothetical protein DRG33_00910 [Deltaproteobacteria bacterium]